MFECCKGFAKADVGTVLFDHAFTEEQCINRVHRIGENKLLSLILACSVRDCRVRLLRQCSVRFRVFSPLVQAKLQTPFESGNSL